MKKKILGIIAGGIMLLSANAVHAGYWGLDNWYIAGSGSVAWHNDHEFKNSSGAIQKRDYKIGGGASASVGYIFDLCNCWKLRLEEELVYRRNSLDTITVSTSDNSTGHTQDIALMTNLLLDVPLQCGFGLYAGGGIGVSFNKIEFTNQGGLPVTPKDISRDELFAWQLMSGIYYDITPCIALTAGYRFFATEKVCNRVGLKSQDIPFTHSIDFGISFKL